MSEGITLGIWDFLLKKNIESFVCYCVALILQGPPSRWTNKN